MSQLSLKKIKLGDNADLSKNFVISTPAVADGTLTIERENGTDVLSVAADGKVTLTPTTEMTPLGVGQTWQNVTASRTTGTDYINNTGRPIQVFAYTTSAGITSLTARVNAVIIAVASAPANAYSSLSFIVPAGATYSLTISNASSIPLWTELR